MQFNSLVFVIFFLVILGIHYLPLPTLVRRCNLLVASYLYYAAWNPRYIPLLFFVTSTNWWAAKWINRLEGVWSRRTVLWGNIALNLGLLGAFKYGNEGIALWSTVATRLGIPAPLVSPSILLPVGLSFFTFQALSYTIDVYRRTLRPASSALDFSIFVSFFPVLLAGPLLRAGPFLPACCRPRRATPEELGWGAALFTLGLFMKVVLADQFLFPVVRKVFDSQVSPTALAGWMGTMAFAGQDYCDFAGYSTCAMGLAACLGFTVPENFRAPLSSIGFRDLWQRWHITLVAWMRDYVFLSLGGVYKGYSRAALNVMIVMILIGLWHGAAWTYLIFGMLHGVYLIGEVLLLRTPLRRMRLWSNAAGSFLLWTATMFLCCIAFVFYRTPDLRDAGRLLVAMFGMSSQGHSTALDDYEILVVSVVLESLIAVHALRRHLGLSEVVAKLPWWAIASGLGLMLYAITLSSGEATTYLYFNY
ncbi:MAG TPA: MBOAT family O-acyltransferase [Pirellulales bacterium]